MPCFGGLAQRLLWVAKSETQQAGAKQSGTAAEIGGVTPEVSCPGAGQPSLHAQAGIGLFPQACSPSDAGCWDRFGETPGL